MLAQALNAQVWYWNWPGSSVFRGYGRMQWLSSKPSAANATFQSGMRDLMTSDLRKLGVDNSAASQKPSSCQKVAEPWAPRTCKSFEPLGRATMLSSPTDDWVKWASYCCWNSLKNMNCAFEQSMPGPAIASRRHPHAQSPRHTGARTATSMSPACPEHARSPNRLHTNCYKTVEPR